MGSWNAGDVLVVGSMPGEFADKVRIMPGRKFEIDGKDFPWYITEDGVQVAHLSRGSLNAVTVTIPCNTIEIEDHATRVEEDK